MIGEPSPTQADLHFRLFGFPVRVHPFFWLVALLLAWGGRDRLDPTEALVWVAVVFVSILVHELGHAFLQRYYGGHPWITLYGLGGLASCDDCDRSPRSQIIISLAGPGAGFLLAAVVVAIILLAGHSIGLTVASNLVALGEHGLTWDWVRPFVLYSARFDPFPSPLLNIAFRNLLLVNILWGLLNLLPIYPLDGGRIARELFTLVGNPRQGIVRSLWLSTIVAALVAVLGLRMGLILLALMFGFLAYSSYQTLQAYRRY